MDRKEFIKTCGFACLGGSTISLLLQSCASGKSVAALITGDNLVVPKSDFAKKDTFHQYILVRNAQLKFPVYLFRFSETEYSALYMQCSHQGNELNAYGDRLVCSAHGSEFDTKGNVTNGPAIKPLRTFPVQTESDNILISLKKI